MTGIMCKHKRLNRCTALLTAMLLALALCFGAFAADIDDSFAAAALRSKEISPTPAFGSEDWFVLALARNGLGDGEYCDEWYASLENTLRESGGELSKGKYTEYSRAVLAVTATGRDARSVAGYDLTLPLADFETVTAQGVNGAAWALIALDCGEYPIPETEAASRATRDSYVELLLMKEISGGGWSLSGDAPDADVTSMVLAALAKYTDRTEVEAAVDRGISALASMQRENGGFSSYGTENAESCVQVIIALCELGISPEDARFVKSGGTVFSALLSYRQTDGSFSHVAAGEGNKVATEQAMCALEAARRYRAGESSLYRISTEEENTAPDAGATESPSLTQTTSISEKSPEPTVITTLADATDAATAPVTGDAGEMLLACAALAVSASVAVVSARVSGSKSRN